MRVNDLLSDMWKYNPTSNEWTWVSGSAGYNQNAVYGTKGVPDKNNFPGGRHSATTWADASGNLYMYGGYGYGTWYNAGTQDDLWRYNIENETWTWLAGHTVGQNPRYNSLGEFNSTNSPGSRYAAAGWYFNNELWLFDGFGGYHGVDVWKYSLSRNQWAWVAGSSEYWKHARNVMTTPGQFHPENSPGRYSSAVAWIDVQGKFWLFGGTQQGFKRNTVWKFDPLNLQWALVRDSTVQDRARYSGPTDTISPGGREDAMAWQDVSGNLWVFGGDGKTESNVGILGDVFLFDSSKGMLGEWSWRGGAQGVVQYGSYGVKEQASPTNMPGGRTAAGAWVAKDGSFYLYGGYGWSSDKQGELNDMWRFEAPGTSVEGWLDY